MGIICLHNRCYTVIYYLIMNYKIFLVCIFTLLFHKVNMLFSQEWEYLLENDSDADECFDFYDAKELSNGNIGIASSFYYRSGYGDFYSAHPAVMILSPDGKELARNSFFREGYTTMSYAPYLFENNGNLYALSTYSPEHDSLSFNHFLNYDNPPTDAKLVLSKLDNELNLLECYEHSFPIDTFENRGWSNWDNHPNEYSGNICLFSAFEDEGNIIGAYFKIVSSDYDNPRGHDSLFFFKMNFNGEILNIKGYERNTNGGWIQSTVRRNQMVKTDSYYILYERVSGNVDGMIVYYDKDFNHIATKYIKQPDYDGMFSCPLKDISVVKTNYNTTYLSVTASCIEKPHSYMWNDIRLYKLDDNIENSSDYLSTDNYIIRGYSNTYDISPLMRAVDAAPDSTLYFACVYDWEGDPYSIIEHLDEDMDTISTLFYDKIIHSIKSTKGGSLLINGSESIAKIPASLFGFEDTESLHEHGFHLAVAYPNPGGDVLNIRTGLRNAVLTVYDLQGRKIHEQEITDDVTSVDASGWKSGTYIWKLGIRNEELGMKEVETGKWVK